MSVVLNAVTGEIGDFTVEAGGSVTGTVSVPGATVASMSVDVSPLTFPGDGITWQGFVSSAGVVTVKVTRITAGYIPPSTYNVNVLTGDGGTPSGGVTASGTLTLNEPVFGNGAAVIKAGTRRGNTTVAQMADTATAPSTGNLAAFDANGNITDAAIGTVSNFQLLNQTGSFALTTAFTASATGVYLISLQLHLVSTNNVGSLSITFGTTDTASQSITPNVSLGADAQLGSQPYYLAAGNNAHITGTASGLTGTTYNVYVFVQRVL